MTLLLATCLTSIFSQQLGITDTGETVILFDDGTWKYQEESIEAESKIPTNPQIFTKDEESSFLLKSKVLNIGLWLNPKEWTFNKASSNEDAEYELYLKNEDLYAMVITEKAEIPLKTLRKIAIDNARLVAPDLKVVHQEYRNVNGIDVLNLQMDGTVEGLKFTYYGYYYSNENGTVQLISYTAQNLIDSYREDADKLLNGFVILE